MTADEARDIQREAIRDAADPAAVAELLGLWHDAIRDAARKGLDRCLFEARAGPALDEVCRQLEEAEFFIENSEGGTGSGVIRFEVSW